MRLTRFEVLTPEITLGGELIFDLEISSTSGFDQALMIDYTVHHMRANGHGV